VDRQTVDTQNIAPGIPACPVNSQTSLKKERWIPSGTRGPRGPWVAHLRKRSKVTVDSIIENPRGII